ncbi:MAG: T9SS type A sorting domain-containing protein [Bacteroidales bacterium]|nr:T9SS type A sorting domain-containing protein [Bacteroidales bacterium]
MKKFYLFLALLLGAINFAQAQCDIILNDISLVKCFGDNPTLNADIDVNWYDADTNLLHTGSTYNPMGMMTMIMPAGNYTYLIQPVGCTKFSSVNLEVVEVPVPHVNYLEGIFLGDNVVFTASSAFMYQFRWQPSIGMVTEGNTYIPNTSITGSYALQVVAYDQTNNCQSEPVSVNYSVFECNANPPVAEVVEYMVENNNIPTLSVTTGNPDEETSFRWYDAVGNLLAQGVSSYTPELFNFYGTFVYYITEFIPSTSCESRRIPIYVYKTCTTQIPTLETTEFTRKINQQPMPISLTNIFTEGETVTWFTEHLEPVCSGTYTPPFTELGYHYLFVEIYHPLNGCSQGLTLSYTILPCLEEPNAISPREVNMFLHETAPVFEVTENSVWYDSKMNKIGEGTSFSPNIFKTGESVFIARQENENCLGDTIPFYLSVKAYTISGRLFYDQNNDGIFDVDYDKAISNKSVLVKETNTVISTDLDGNYSFQTDKLGTYTLSVQEMGKNVETLSNEEIVVTLNNEKLFAENVDFRFRIKDNYDLSVSAIPSNIIAVGRDVYYYLTVKNSGNVQENVSLKFTYNASLMDIVPIEFNNATLTDSTITVKLGTVQELSTLVYSFPFIVKPNWKIGGDTIFTHVEVLSAYTDVWPEDNTFETADIIRNSYDPNDKAVTPSMLEEGFVLLNSELTYTIRFQNKGTGEAYDIYIKDTIDEKMDISSFEFMTASHNMTYAIDGNIITFYFTNIKLPYESADAAGSNGYLQYSIKPKTGMADRTVVNNTAHIFFDFNPAVVTNTTISTFVEKLPVLKVETGLDKNTPSIFVSPNPVAAQLNITASLTGNKQVSLVDMSGVSELIGAFDGQSATFDVSKKPSGSYTLLITNGLETITEKVIIK